MKKTLTANIGGTVFHIEEDAYDRLQRYLASIRGQFAGSASAGEIMADIEARIAELFQQRLESRQVVDIADVEHVIGVMGQPEDYLGGEEEAAPETGAGPTGQRRHRRLYRDTDDRWLAGVLSGIAAYFRIDPLIIRLIFIVFIIISLGSALLIYVLLWIVVPPALTAAEKLEMRGEPVNVDNIKRVFEEGAERVKKGAEQMASEAKDLGRNWNASELRKNTNSFFGFLGEMVRLFLRALGKFIGLILLVFGAGMAVFLVVLLLGRFDFLLAGDALPPGTSMKDWSDLLFISSRQGDIAWISAILFVLVPVIGLLYGGISLLFDVKGPRWLGWTLAPVWIASIVALSIIGIQVGNDFRVEEELSEEVAIQQPAGGVMYLRMIDDPHLGRSHGRHHDHHWSGPAVDGDRMLLAWTDVDVHPSPDSLFHLVMERTACGANYERAAERAGDIRSAHQQTDSVLGIPPLYSIGHPGKFRDQSVRYVLQVPKGKSVHLEESIGRLLDDVQNVSDTWDWNMVGRTWTMTPEGLKDLNLPEEKKEGEEREGAVQYEAPADEGTDDEDLISAIVFRGLPKRCEDAPVSVTGPAQLPVRAASVSLASNGLLDLLGRI